MVVFMPEIVATTEPAPITEIASQAAATLHTAAPVETAFAIGLPIAALIISALVNRWIGNRQAISSTARFFHFMASLLAPLLTLLFVVVTQRVMQNQHIETTILPFEIKLALAWLAIRLVLTLSERNTAGWFIALIIIPVTTLHVLGLWPTVSDMLQQVQFKVADHEFTLYLVLKTIAALIILIWAASALTTVTERRIRRIKRMHVSNRVLVMKIFQIVLYFVVFMVGLQIVGVDLTALSVIGGAIGVGIGFGLQKIASNFISGIILLFEKSVEIGDLIELADGTTGFIRHNGARYTLLEKPDGKEVLIPNEEFINNRVTSLTYSGSRGRIDITLSIDYASDVGRAMQIMLESARGHKRTITIPEPLCFLTTFGENGMGITLFFWVGDIEEGTMATKSEVMLVINKKFREEGIEFASPRQVHLRPKKAKAAT